MSSAGVKEMERRVEHPKNYEAEVGRFWRTGQTWAASLAFDKAMDVQNGLLLSSKERWRDVQVPGPSGLGRRRLFDQAAPFTGESTDFGQEQRSPSKHCGTGTMEAPTGVEFRPRLSTFAYVCS